MTLDIQFKTMLAMIMAGFCVGIHFETFRYFTPLWYKVITLRYILEVLFWCSQTILVFLLLYKVNTGELRFYLFLALFLGYSIYKSLFAPLYKRALVCMIKIVKGIFIFLEKLVRYIIVKPMIGLVVVVWTMIIFLVRIIMTPLFYLLQPVGKLLIALKNGIQKYSPKPILKIMYKYSRIYGIIKDKLKKIKSYVTF